MLEALTVNNVDEIASGITEEKRLSLQVSFTGP